MKNKKTKKVSSFQLVDPNFSFILMPMPGHRRNKMRKTLINCQPLLLFCHKHRDTFLVCLLVLSLSIIFSGYNYNGDSKTFFGANQRFINDYAVFMADAYGGMAKQTIIAWGGIVYPVTQINVVLKDTVEAYAAMFRVAARPMSKFFENTGQVLAAMYCAATQPEQVLAAVGP